MNYVIDLSRLEYRHGDHEAQKLTPREGEILFALVRHRGRVVTRQEFLNSVWGYPLGSDVSTRTVENTIGALRRKIEPDPNAPQIIITVHGAGWKLGEGVPCEG